MIKLIKSVESPSEREALIKEILSRGKNVVFKNKINGVEKRLDAWNPDEDGDLIAYYSTGKTKCICWEADEYEVSEIDAV